MRPVESKESRTRAHILGLGIDNDDGHKRITRAEKFSVVGGCEETHGKITETLIKTFEDLKKRGRELEESEPSEIAELLHKHRPTE